jgi:hypothetical protein
MSNEKKVILDLLASGKINSDEAEKLLAQVSQVASSPQSNNKKFLHIKINDGDETTVNINLPLVLAETGLKLIPKDKLHLIADKGIDVEDLLTLISGDTKDSIIDINTTENGKNVSVKIYID